jgi:Uma2 family endonuclease
LRTYVFTELLIILNKKYNEKIFYYRTSEGYEVGLVIQDNQGKYEIIQVVWEATDSLILAREEHALRQEESELGFAGKLVDWTSYFKPLSL